MSTGGGLSPITRTVNDVLRAVKRQFGDESGVQVEDNDVITWINDAQDTIVNRNRILKARSVTQTVIDQPDYTFPSDNVLQIESLHYAGAALPNMSFPQAEEKIFAEDPDHTATGKPILWYEWAGTVTLWPIPNEEKDLTLYYTQKPARVTQASDTLSVTDKYFPDVVRYVMQQAYEMDEDWEAVQAKQKQFDSSVNDLGEEERTAEHMTYAIIGLVD